MSTNKNLAIKDQFVTAALSGDAATVKALAHPNFEMSEGAGLPFAGSYRGADAFLDFLRIFGETFDIQSFDSVRTYVTDDPDWLVSEFELRATVRATGAFYETSLVEVWHFEDGKVRSVKPHYFNALSAG